MSCSKFRPLSGSSRIWVEFTREEIAALVVSTCEASADTVTVWVDCPTVN
jgi:hypothetical protein